MEETNSQIRPAVTMVALHTQLFYNSIDGISEETAQKRPNSNSNHIAWIAGHTLSARYTLANVCGVPDKEPFPELFLHGKSIEAGDYPSLEEMKVHWKIISEKLLSRLKEIDEKTLNGNAPFKLPVDDPTVRGTIAFFVHHEAYHIGQLSLVRKIFGSDAMKYS